MEAIQLISKIKLARLCNTQPWVIDRMPSEEMLQYEELMVAIAEANEEIMRENQQRIKRKDTTLLRRITLAD